MSIAHPKMILDHISYQFKLVRSDTYKFFQNWLRVHIMLKKSIRLASEDNFFMKLMLFTKKLLFWIIIDKHFLN